MFSALTKEGADITMEALSIGASDFITKDFANVSLNISAKDNEMINKVKQVAKRKASFILRRLINANKQKAVSIDTNKMVRHNILSIGASTGGPPALQHIISSLPKDFPVPIIIAQHMPRLFTQSFSQRLNSLAKIDVKEAEDKEPLRPGVVFVTPGDTHLGVRQKGREVIVEFVNDKSYIYRPSVDLLMRTTAEVYGPAAVGVILTGMGNDGLEGIKMLKSRGGFVIAQDEDTSVVYGMPKAVVNANLADAVLPIDRIPEEIIKVL
jgi:two-component system chemotaxis response regulator CheB